MTIQYYYTLVHADRCCDSALKSFTTAKNAICMDLILIVMLCSVGVINFKE